VPAAVPVLSPDGSMPVLVKSVPVAVSRPVPEAPAAPPAAATAATATATPRPLGFRASLLIISARVSQPLP
jgi:hypothetical protein